jgi:hypothetical protein
MWLILQYGMKAGEVLTFMRFGLNLLQFPIHILITWFILKAVMKIPHLQD